MQQSIWEWNLDPTILIGLAAWTLGYIYLTGPLRQRKHWGPPFSRTRQLAFHLGTLIAFFALASPLDHLSDDFLLSAHMVQHLLLIIGVAPLWLLGFPASWLDAMIPVGMFRKILYRLTRPVVAYIIFYTVFLSWHIPAFYDAALENEAIHAIEHLTFIGGALLAWWPLLGFLPKAAPRASYPIQMVYCFALMIPSIMLGVIISLSSSPIYPAYVDAPAVIGTNLAGSAPGGGRLWGLSVIQDQQISGMIMWVPANMMYLTAFWIILSKWFSENARRDREKYIQEDQLKAKIAGKSTNNH